MLKTPVFMALTLAIAFGLGVSSLWWALERVDGLSQLTINGWSARPFAGSERADPYSRARAAREASLPLGHAEGIVFTAFRDSDGRELRRDCAYAISGAMPSARFYTVHARGSDDAVIATGNLRAPALHSGGLLRGSDGQATIAIGPSAAPGNWLPVTGTGAMTIVLTLYDTPVVASADIGAIDLPGLTRGACNG